jgi:hypothetical protein
MILLYTMILYDSNYGIPITIDIIPVVRMSTITIIIHYYCWNSGIVILVIYMMYTQGVYDEYDLGVLL